MSAEKGARGSTRAREGVTVDRVHDEDVERVDHYILIRCVECGAQVDKVEWSETDGRNPHVDQLVSLLGCDEKTAAKIISDQNPDLLLSQEERATDLARHIAAQDVPDRDADTYACPNGHDAGLEVDA